MSAEIHNRLVTMAWEALRKPEITQDERTAILYAAGCMNVRQEGDGFFLKTKSPCSVAWMGDQWGVHVMTVSSNFDFTVSVGTASE